jgi:phospholipid N-methyltransferase
MSHEIGGSDAPRPKRGSDLLLVVRKFFSNAKSVATVAPSSRSMARAAIRGIDWSNTRCLVELGAGTGPITRELVAAAPPGVRLVINEFDADFCRVLREKFPTADVVEGDAGRLQKMLTERGIDGADYVLSGLPLTHFTPADRDALIDQVGAVLAPGFTAGSTGGTFARLHFDWLCGTCRRAGFITVVGGSRLMSGIPMRPARFDFPEHLCAP